MPRVKALKNSLLGFTAQRLFTLVTLLPRLLEGEVEGKFEVLT